MKSSIVKSQLKCGENNFKAYIRKNKKLNRQLIIKKYMKMNYY